MSNAKIVRDTEGQFYGISFNCPGCTWSDGSPMPCTLHVNWLPVGEQESPHAAGKPHWGFNGDFDAPTFTPSINSWWGGDGEGDDHIPLHRCHTFITDGRIQFLGDCTHALVGQTVDLPEIDE